MSVGLYRMSEWGLESSRNFSKLAINSEEHTRKLHLANQYSNSFLLIRKHLTHCTADEMNDITLMAERDFLGVIVALQSKIVNAVLTYLLFY